jgi:NAD+ kinase
VADRKKGTIRTVGIVVRPNDRVTAERAAQLADWLAKRGLTVLAHDGWVEDRAAVSVVDRSVIMRTADLVVVLGGDGSLLGIARLSGPRPVPVLGIHHGDFGFLTDAGRDDLYGTVEKALAGEFTVQRRTMLAVAVRRGDKVVARSQALNDAVISRGPLSRMLTLEVTVGTERLAEYLGDGLIIATPTGSTAYSLSAGGPVVEPTMSAMLVTPISPHTLSSRPLVLSDRAKGAVHVARHCEGAALSVDGQEAVALEPRDTVEVTKSRNHATIATVSGEDFFSILRRKLHWGARGERSSLRRRV